MKTLLAAFLLLFSMSANAAWVFPDKSGDVTNDKTALTTAWNTMLADSNSFVNLSTGGTGGLPCTSINILGKNTSFCLNTYSDNVKTMATLVMFMALLLSIFIILR